MAKIDKTEAKKLMVAAASRALDFKASNPKASDEDAIRHVLENSEAIIRNAY